MTDIWGCDTCRVIFMDQKPDRCPLCGAETSIYEWKTVNGKHVLVHKFTRLKGKAIHASPGRS